MSLLIPKLGEDILNEILPRIDNKIVSIFLVGADLSRNDTIRKLLYTKLSNEKDISIFFPERLMTEVFYSDKIDFLSLENLLAENVCCVVMCIESPGSIAELGAFVNHIKLRNKLIVILDKKYEKDRSFINLGPVKMVKKKRVMWYDFKNGNSDELTRKVIKKINSLSNSVESTNEITNPLVAESFIFAMLYILDSSARRDIIGYIKNMDLNDYESSIIMVKATLSSLSWQGFVSLKDKKYRLTKNGMERFKNLIKHNYLDTIELLDNLRVDVLNKDLRNR